MKTVWRHIFLNLGLFMGSTSMVRAEIVEHPMQHEAIPLSTPHEAKVQRYEAAARAGDMDALSYYLDALVFRANSVTAADPERAYAFLSELLEERRRKPRGNESEYLWRWYDEALECLRMAAEAGPFDGHAFLARHGLDSPDGLPGIYEVWEWAEQAALGVFGDPDPDLIFQLVIRGGMVPNEWKLAVRDVYPKWKAGKTFEFDLCRYVGSSMGVGFCNSRRADQQEWVMELRIAAMQKHLPTEWSHLPQDVYQAAKTYFRSKAETEEGHGGFGGWRFRHIENATLRHVREFMRWLEARQDPRLPYHERDPQKTKSELEYVLSQLAEILAEGPYVEPAGYEIAWEGIAETQRRWEDFRDVLHALLNAIHDETYADAWIEWLYARRTWELERTLGLVTGLGYIK